MANLTERVRELIAATFGIDVDETPETASQATLAEWSSLNHVLLMAAVEDAFDVRLTMQEMLHMTSVPTITAVLSGRGAAVGVA